MDIPLHSSRIARPSPTNVLNSSSADRFRFPSQSKLPSTLSPLDASAHTEDEAFYPLPLSPQKHLADVGAQGCMLRGGGRAPVRILDDKGFR